MPNAKHVLIAVDNSEASYRAVTYVGSIIGGRRDCRVCLLHALPPLPRQLLACAESSAPQHAEEDVRLRVEQARWGKVMTQAAAPVFAHAKRLLREARVPLRAVETQIVETVKAQDLIRAMLAAAQMGQCGTVVVGRESLHGLKALVTSHVGDTLVRQAQGLTVWVVE